MSFLNPLDALIPKPHFIICRFLGLGHLLGPGVSLGRILGVLLIEPFFFGWGGSGRRALSTPPPRNQSPASPARVERGNDDNDSDLE